MCINTLKKQELKKYIKIPQRGYATPPNVQKLGVSGAKDTAKTNFRVQNPFKETL